MATRRGVRTCGATCHEARGKKCRCWCGGLFHGGDAVETREAFRVAIRVEELPTTEQKFRELTGQPSLFSDGLSAGDEWRGRHERTRQEQR